MPIGKNSISRVAGEKAAEEAVEVKKPATTTTRKSGTTAKAKTEGAKTTAKTATKSTTAKKPAAKKPVAEKKPADAPVAAKEAPAPAANEATTISATKMVRITEELPTYLL